MSVGPCGRACGVNAKKRLQSVNPIPFRASSHVPREPPRPAMPVMQRERAYVKKTR
jgi:hypothetical protein